MSLEKSWFAVDGTLESIDFPGPSYFRCPEPVVRRVLEAFSVPGARVLDPFVGLGTTLAVGASMHREVVGFEKDPERAAFAATRVTPPSRLIPDSCANIDDYSLAPFDLLFTSPPYKTLRNADPEGFHFYLEDFASLFRKFPPLLNKGARIVVEMSNVRTPSGVWTRAWDGGKILSEVFDFEREIVRCNTGPSIEGLGYDHSYLYVFKKKER